MELKVRKNTKSQLLAKKIAEEIEGREELMLSCIGASAVNQAVKAVAHMNEDGMVVRVIPKLKLIEVDGKEVKCMTLKLKKEA